MAKENKIRKLEKRKFELIRNIKLCRVYKKQILRFSKDLNKEYNKGLIGYNEYKETLDKKLENKTVKYWIDYYSNYLQECRSELNNCERVIRSEEIKLKVIPLIAVIAVLALIGFGVFVIRPTITGLVVGVEEDKEKDLYEFNYDSKEKLYHKELENVRTEIKDTGDVELSKWNKEVKLTIEKPNIYPALSLSNAETSDNKLITKTSDKVDLNYYFKEVSNSDGFEYEVVLKEKPSTNVISFSIDSENLEFYYQPALDEEYGYSNESCNATDCEGVHRPIDVVGSYAVYHSSKMNNEYMTGKAFHIYRPLIIDAKKDSIWAELNIENDVMTITISQEFLDKAKYPVVIDPGFGFAGIGETPAEGVIIYMVGGKFASGGAGTLDSMTWYLDSDTWASLNGYKITYAIYEDGVDGVKVDVTDEYTFSDESNGWFELNFPDTPADITDQDYWLYVWSDEEGGVLNAVVYDNGGDSRYANIDVLTPTIFYPDYPADLDDDDFYMNQNYRFSVYCNYTEGGANNAPTTPVLNAPPDKTYILDSDLNIHLNWSNSSDQDGDPITYFLQVWNESGMSNLMYANNSITETTNTTGDLVSFPNETSADFFWRVLAMDGTDNSSWTGLRNVSIGYTAPTNNNPTNPSPIANSTVVEQTNYTNEDLACNFLCSDPDTEASMTYDITWYKDGEANQSYSSVSCTDESYVSTNLESENTSKGELWACSVNLTDDESASSSTIFSNNVTIENSAPTITYVSLNRSITPSDGGISKFEFSFIASDNDGVSDLDTAIANVSFGSYSYLNNSCNDEGSGNYSCTIEMQYFWSSGSWNYGTEINDSSGVSIQNSTLQASESQTWIYSELIALNLSSSSLAWDTLAPLDKNKTSTTTITIENTGNKELLDIRTKLIDLGCDADTTYIPAGNFSVFNSTTNDLECESTNQSSAVTPGVNPLIGVNNTNIYPVLNALARGQGVQENLYYCLFDVPQNLGSYDYNTTFGGSWDISVE